MRSLLLRDWGGGGVAGRICSDVAVIPKHPSLRGAGGSVDNTQGPPLDFTDPLPIV